MRDIYNYDYDNKLSISIDKRISSLLTNQLVLSFTAQERQVSQIETTYEIHPHSYMPQM